jgi:hypothetical protein
VATAFVLGILRIARAATFEMFDFTFGFGCSFGCAIFGVSSFGFMVLFFLIFTVLWSHVRLLHDGSAQRSGFLSRETTLHSYPQSSQCHTANVRSTMLTMHTLVSE